MSGGDLLRLSVGNLGRRKIRTALTTVGVIIGVGALVVMVSLGLGVEREVLGLFKADTFLR